MFQTTSYYETETKTKHSGLKNELICYLLLEGHKAVSRGDVDWNRFFHGRRRQFWSSPSNQGVRMRVAPRNEVIHSFNPDNGVHVERHQRTSSLVFFSEFPTEYDEAQLTQIRIEQQRRDQRDGFWKVALLACTMTVVYKYR